jgi:malonyl-CoA O-methyltransferase
MLERLDYMKIAPRRILDAGSGPGRDAARLARRYKGARVVALDFSPAMLRAGRRRLLERRDFVAGDLTRLPIAANAMDFVWSNMALHWADAEAALREFARVLAPEGLLMFSTLGPDSLKELRAAAGAGRVHAFVDMHDLGDLLVAAGFTAPVMDMELITFSYEDARRLLGDLRASGQTSAREDRPRGLAGREFLTRVTSTTGTRATFEVVYGHAWKGAPRKLADGRDIVRFRAR